MRNLLCLLAMLASTVATAAADLPRKYTLPQPPAATDYWSGLYIGGHGGWHWADTAGVKADAYLVGGHIGYQRQLGSNVVVGIELDGGTTGMAEVSWLATARLRAGYLLTPQLLVYGTGGGAYGRLSDTMANLSITGWVVGGGVEYALARNLSARVEYRHHDVKALTGMTATSDAVFLGASLRF